MEWILLTTIALNKRMCAGNAFLFKGAFATTGVPAFLQKVVNAPPYKPYEVVLIETTSPSIQFVVQLGRVLLFLFPGSLGALTLVAILIIVLRCTVQGWCLMHGNTGCTL